jgi:hypothetical protein
MFENGGLRNKGKGPHRQGRTALSLIKNREKIMKKRIASLAAVLLLAVVPGPLFAADNPWAKVPPPRP